LRSSPGPVPRVVAPRVQARPCASTTVTSPVQSHSASGAGSGNTRRSARTGAAPSGRNSQSTLLSVSSPLEVYSVPSVARTTSAVQAAPCSLVKLTRCTVSAESTVQAVETRSAAAMVGSEIPRTLARIFCSPVVASSVTYSVRGEFPGRAIGVKEVRRRSSRGKSVKVDLDSINEEGEQEHRDDSHRGLDGDAEQHTVAARGLPPLLGGRLPGLLHRRAVPGHDLLGEGAQPVQRG